MGSKAGMSFTFAQTSVTGSYSVNANCTGTATVTPKGQPAQNYSFVIVNGGNEMLPIETDSNTVVTGIVQR